MNKLSKLTQVEIEIWNDAEQRNRITNLKTSHSVQQNSY